MQRNGSDFCRLEMKQLERHLSIGVKRSLSEGSKSSGSECADVADFADEFPTINLVQVTATMTLPDECSCPSSQGATAENAPKPLDCQL